MQRLVVGCPVAQRDWVLGDWFDRLAEQTRKPDGLVFVHSGERDDPTWKALQAGATLLGLPYVRIVHDGPEVYDRFDRERYEPLARLRNRLLSTVWLLENPAVFVSLDSDVLLTDPSTLEHLERAIVDEGWDTAGPVLWLQPPGGGKLGAYNAGWWGGGTPGSPDRGWFRPEPGSIAWGEQVQIDIPMAATAMNPRVLKECRYRPHTGGEDIGFAQDLDRIHARSGWLTGLEATHVWNRAHLDQLYPQVG